ncbi:MAG TPA: hypothetical protein ENO14_03515, partial [Chromatiales bacterium]|nr:hypothetical protein [Chromatiales bacterium]
MNQVKTRSPAPPATADEAHERDARATGPGDNHGILVLLEGICRRFSITSLGARISEIQENATENDHVDVVVLGRFKSGKSSLLNALLGRDVLPIDVLPSTAVVTRVVAGRRDRACVVGEDGTAADIDLGEIRRYVTERENPDNAKGVARVDVELAKSRIPAGLRLVDTPGVGSLHRHNTDVAERWLPRVGAALVAISADQPLSEQDVALLEELRPFTPFATIVLTKVDLLEPDQVGTVEA